MTNYRTTSFSDFYAHLLVTGFVRLSSAANRWNILKTTAPYWRIYWNDKPGACLSQADRQISLHPDILALIPPNAVFSSCCQAPKVVQHFYLHFNIYPPQPDIPTEIIITQISPIQHAMIQKIIRRLQTNLKPEFQDTALSLAAKSLVEWTLASSLKKWQITPSWDKRIVKITRYIAEHLNQPLCLDDLAHLSNMSVSGFRTLFREQTGQTPHAYVNSKRVEKAAQLLHTRDYPLKEIAARVGFYDSQHFSRVFQRLQGVTPGEFRRLGDNPFVMPS